MFLKPNIEEGLKKLTKAQQTSLIWEILELSGLDR